MSEQLRPLPELYRDLCELAVSIDHYERQDRTSEADQARTDYAGLLAEVCTRLNTTRVHHPLLGDARHAPAGIFCIPNFSTQPPIKPNE